MKLADIGFFKMPSSLARPLIGLVFGFSLLSGSARAELQMDLQTNFVTGGLFSFNAKSLGFFGVGSSWFKFGPFGMFNQYQNKFREFAAGGYLQLGGNVFMRAGAGKLQQEIYQDTKIGSCGIFMVGYQFSSNFIISLPLIYRHTASETEEISRVDSYPMLGITATLF